MSQARTADPTLADRQRDRAARGIGSRAGARPADRPSPPRRRRPALALLAALLIVGGAAVAGLVALRLDSRQPVVVLAQDVPAGTQITEELIATADVASEGLALVPFDQRDQVIGTYTQVPIAEGQLLELPMLTTATPLKAGTTQIGVPLRAGATPAGLRSGDLVRLIRLSDGNSEPVPIATALVLSTSTSTEGGTLGGEDSQSSAATLLVPAASSDVAVDAAANDRLGIALSERGVRPDEATIRPLGSGQ